MHNKESVPPVQADADQIYFNINQAAKAVGVVPATIRNWEREGLFIAKRKSNNYRVFDFSDIELLKQIKVYSSKEGMSLGMIRRLLASPSPLTQSAERKYPKNIYHTKLKEYRERRNYTLEDVSAAVGISPSYLSRIEQGQANVSLDILEKLASFYGESTLTFFGVKPEVHALVRRGEGQQMETKLVGVRVESLVEDAGNCFGSMRFLAQPSAGDHVSHRHYSGKEFIYVVSGKLQVTLDEKEIYVLKPGDTILFESTRLHRWHNPGKKLLEMIWYHSRL